MAASYPEQSRFELRLKFFTPLHVIRDVQQRRLREVEVRASPMFVVVGTRIFHLLGSLDAGESDEGASAALG